MENVPNTWDPSQEKSKKDEGQSLGIESLTTNLNNISDQLKLIAKRNNRLADYYDVLHRNLTDLRKSEKRGDITLEEFVKEEAQIKAKRQKIERINKSFSDEFEKLDQLYADLLVYYDKIEEEITMSEKMNLTEVIKNTGPQHMN